MCHNSIGKHLTGRWLEQEWREREAINKCLRSINEQSREFGVKCLRASRDDSANHNSSSRYRQLVNISATKAEWNSLFWARNRHSHSPIDGSCSRSRSFRCRIFQSSIRICFCLAVTKLMIFVYHLVKLRVNDEPTRREKSSAWKISEQLGKSLQSRQRNRRKRSLILWFVFHN